MRVETYNKRFSETLCLSEWAEAEVDGGLVQQSLCARSKSILDSLQNHWALGTLRLREFRYLFVESEDRVKLLNAITGGAFLYDVQ